MAKQIEDATTQELAGILSVVSVGKDTRYCKGETVTITDEITVITKADQEFLKLVLREAQRRLQEVG